MSNYGPKQLTRVHAYLEERGVKIGTVQVGNESCPKPLHGFKKHFSTSVKDAMSQMTFSLPSLLLRAYG